MATRGHQKASNVQARRARGISMLLAGVKHHEIARKLGVSTRQVARWAALPEVRATAAEAEVSAPANARAVLEANATKAAETLVALLDDGSASAADRTRAALAVLDRTGHGATTKSETQVTGKDGGPVDMTAKVSVDGLVRIARTKKEG